MAIASISIHGVRGIHTEVHPLDTVSVSVLAPLVIRKLIITNRDGERLEFTLFSDDADALKVQHTDDADRRSLDLALQIKDMLEDAR